jgi:hypothetical protein
MSELWFVAAPRPMVILGDITVLYAQSDDRGWAVAKQPIHDVEPSPDGSVLIANDEPVTWAGGLVVQLGYQLDSIGVGVPGLRSEDITFPAAELGQAGRPTIVRVADRWLYGSRWHFGEYVAAVTVADNNLVAAVAPDPGDLALTWTKDYRTIS